MPENTALPRIDAVTTADDVSSGAFPTANSNSGATQTISSFIDTLTLTG